MPCLLQFLIRSSFKRSKCKSFHFDPTLENKALANGCFWGICKVERWLQIISIFLLASYSLGLTSILHDLRFPPWAPKTMFFWLSKICWIGVPWADHHPFLVLSKVAGLGEINKIIGSKWQGFCCIITVDTSFSHFYLVFSSRKRENELHQKE